MRILLYTSYLHVIGGIETFILSYLDMLAEYHPEYEVGVICPKCHEEMAAEIEKRCSLYTRRDELECDVLVMVRMSDEIPYQVSYKKAIRMCHCMKIRPTWDIKRDCDNIVHVSEASKNSFHTDGVVIHNPAPLSNRVSLLLVSATRVPAKDKGNNADRILKLAKMLERSEIQFLWLNFSDAPIENAPNGFINVGTYHDIGDFIAKADYLVQLSDHEGFCYSVLEALENKTAVICTPFETTKELGVIDGVNGYIVPYDLDFDVEKLTHVPSFDYKYNNREIMAAWDKLFKQKPKRSKKAEVMVEVLVAYRDLQLNRMVRNGEKLIVKRERALELKHKNLVREVL